MSFQIELYTRKNTIATLSSHIEALGHPGLTTLRQTRLARVASFRLTDLFLDALTARDAETLALIDAALDTPAAQRGWKWLSHLDRVEAEFRAGGVMQ